MILVICSDARHSAVPSIQHVRRYLQFVKEYGSEFVLVGRGSAIIIRPWSMLGRMLIELAGLVQRLFPAPWPEFMASTAEEAEKFLDNVISEAVAELAEQRI